MSNFETLGGWVFERTVNGVPSRWKCGLDEGGRRLDPPDIDGQIVVHRLSHEGFWEGVIATPETEAERNLWQEL